MSTAWRVLALYSAWSAIMQLEWLRFAPITDQVALQYGVSAGEVGLLSLVFPLLFLPLALPSGALIDRISVRLALRLVAGVMLAGVLLRALVPGFGALVAGQALIALVQPLLMALVSKLVLVWFAEEQRLKATGLATMALFLGVGLAFVAVPQSAEAPIAPTLWLDVILVAVVAALTFVLIPADATQMAKAASGRSWFQQTASLLRRPAFIAVLALIFLGNGYFNAIFTWLEQLLKPRGIGAEAAGGIGLLILFGGLAGMGLAARFTQLAVRVRLFLICAALASLPLTAAFMQLQSYAALCVVGFALGALMLAPLPILIGLCAELAGPALAGTALSAFWLAGNAGAAAVIWALSVPADSGNWTVGSWMLAALLSGEALIALGLRRQGRM